jgi:hypothetical protein
MFMGVVSVLVGVWIVVYLFSSRLVDPFARVLALAGCALFLAVGGYQFYRRATRGPES